MKIKNFVSYSILILSFMALAINNIAAKSLIDSIGFSVTAISNTNEIVVEINGIYYQQVDLTIKDVAGETLYTERIGNRPSYRKKMVMDLPKGSYFLTIENDKSIQKRTLLIQDGKIEVKSSDLSPFTNPEFKQDGQHFLVSMTAHTPSEVKLIFIDSAGETFFTDNLMVAKNLNRNYDISSLPAGYYNVQLINGEQIYYSDLVVR